MLSLDDTIAAVATPLAGGARAVLRISGHNTLACLRECFFPADGWNDHDRASARVLSGEFRCELRIPCDAYVWPSAKSYTREPAAELHTIGSPPLVEVALRAVCTHGVRLAQPGEFTLRAFLAGRLDLTQAEAVLGVIDAHDRRELSIALSQLAGGLAGPLARLRGQLLDLLADLEAGLDFAEEHIEFVAADEVARRLQSAEEELQSLLDTMSSRSLDIGLPRVAIIGWPNAGKSSLFNALAGREQSIVSNVAGTTRDYLQATIHFGAAAFMLIDTAGVEAATDRDSIAAAAQRLAGNQAEQADVRLLCIDSTRPLNSFERERLATEPDALVVLTKCDCPRAVPLDRPAIETSALRRQGLDDLQAAVVVRLNAQPAPNAVASTAARCRASVERAIASLADAGRLAAQHAGDELVASDTRLAIDELAKITGAVYTEDILDRIFSRFCIGK